MTGCKIKKIDGTFRIPHDSVQSAFEECKKLEPGAWVYKDFDLAPDMEKLLNLWGWKVKSDETCFIIFDFERPNRIIGDDEFLFEALAPYSEKDSFFRFEAYDSHTKTDFAMMWKVENQKLVCQLCN